MPFLRVTCCAMDLSGQPTSGAAQRRKQRRLRSWWRHKQLSIAAAMATFQHHSAQRQKTAKAGEAVRVAAHGEVPEAPLLQPVLFSSFDEEPCGRRPASLAEPKVPQERVQRHTVEQLADFAPMVKILDNPVPQTVNQLIEILMNDVVQVIEVPKISQDFIPQRTLLSEPQLQESLTVQ